MPAPCAPARGEVRIEGVAPEVRVDRHRVRQRRLVAARLEVGRGVGARGRADVAALGVREHQQPRRARVGAGVLEGAHPVRAERLEERELRLDGDDVRRDRVDDPAAEARAALGRARRSKCGSPRARQAAGRDADRGRRRAGCASARPPRRAGRRTRRPGPALRSLVQTLARPAERGGPLVAALPANPS